MHYIKELKDISYKADTLNNKNKDFSNRPKTVETIRFSCLCGISEGHLFFLSVNNISRYFPAEIEVQDKDHDIKKNP